MAGEDIKASQIDLYEGGEYWALSAVLDPAARALVHAAGIDAAHHVLDVAAGDGSVALAAARRGAWVVATDLSGVQVRRGQERCGRESVEVQWGVADAERLPFPDSSFDGVLSAFGVVAAPEPDVAAAELFRVCRAGGIVGLTAWSSGSYMVELVSALRETVADEMVFPERNLGWGDEAVVRERLGRYAADLAVSRESLAWDPAVRAAAGSADCAAAYFAGRLSSAKLVELGGIRASVEQRFKTSDGLIRADYLSVTARAARRS